jgi:uncharacterized lipoprotein NlpE involved in copper resistance
MKKIISAWMILMVIYGCDNRKEGDAMRKKSEPIHTKCMGRSLIEMPGYLEESRITTGIFRNVGSGSQVPSFNVTVSAAGMTRPQFVAATQRRRAELKNTQSQTIDVLKFERDVDDDTVLFRVQRIDDAYVSEVNLFREGNLITVTLNSYDDQFSIAEAALLKFTQAISVRPKKDSSDASIGFCLGPVSIFGDFEQESASFLFGDPKHLSLGVEIDTYTPDETVPLLARMSGPASLLGIFDLRHGVIRSGERQAAGMRAQEWLGWAKLSEESSAKSLKFILETVRPVPGKATPSINVTLNSKPPAEGGATSVAEEDDLVQVWDSIIKSIHPGTI